MTRELRIFCNVCRRTPHVRLRRPGSRRRGRLHDRRDLHAVPCFAHVKEEFLGGHQEAVRTARGRDPGRRGRSGRGKNPRGCASGASGAGRDRPPLPCRPNSEPRLSPRSWTRTSRSAVGFHLVFFL